MPPKQKTNLPDVHKMIDFALESLPRLETAENENVVLVVGNTGSGKSTLVNYLLRCEMQKELVRNRVRAVAKYPEMEFAKIGHSKESETFYPAVYKSIEDEELALCDCPGFQDNRTKEEEALTYVNMQLVVEAAANIRAMIVVIEIESFNVGRGDELRQLIKTLGTLLKKATENLGNSTLFAITKTKEGDTQENILEEIEELITSHSKNLKKLEKNKENNAEEIAETESVLQLLRLIQKNSNNIVMVDVFDQFQSKEIIFQKLHQLQTIDKSIFDFSRFDDARVKFNHAINYVVSEAEKVLRERLELPEFIKQYTQDKSKAETSRSEIVTRKNNLSSQVQLSAQEKSAEIKRSKKTIQDYQSVIDKKQIDIRKLKSALKKLNAELVELDTEDLEKYWEDKLRPENPQGFIDSLRYFFRFFDRKQFSYDDIPFDCVQPISTNGKFDVYSNNSEYGLYKADYRSGFLQHGDGKVTIFLKRRDIPANKMRIEAILADIKSIKEYIRRKSEEIQLIENDIEEENNFINSLQSEHAEIQKECSVEKERLNRRIKRLDDNLLLYDSELTAFEQRLKSTEDQFSQNKTAYLFFAKICRLLKIDSSLVNAFITLAEQALISPTLEKKYTLLHTAANLGIYSAIIYLVKRRVNLNAQDADGNTPLHHAIIQENFKSAICLVLNGANITIQNYNKEDSLSLLIENTFENSKTLAKYLLALMLCLEPRKLEYKSNVLVTEIMQLCGSFRSQNQSFKEPVEDVLASRLISHQHKVKLNKAFHTKAFKEMFTFTEIAPLLEILRFAVLGLHDFGPNPLTITVDSQNGSTNTITLGDADAYGIYYGDSHTIYLAGKRDNDPEASKFAARGTFIHEVNHFVANEVFKNNCNPYFAQDEISKKRFADICLGIYSRKDTLHERLSSVFQYPQSQWHIELIVRIPQLIAMENGYTTVKNQCPELLAYYQEIFIPACQEHLFWLRQKNLILSSNITFRTESVFDHGSTPKQTMSQQQPKTLVSLMTNLGIHSSPIPKPQTSSGSPSSSNSSPNPQPGFY